MARAAQRRVYTICETVSVGRTPHVKTVTENLAHLVAFTRACEWALGPEGRGAPAIIRYTNEYAANVATGLWRPRKHRPMAAAAQLAFRTLRERRGGNVWIEHVKQDQRWAAMARDHATRAKGGENGRSRDVD